MKLYTLLVISVVTILTACYGQSLRQSENTETSGNQIVTGDTVSQPGNNIMVIYQDSKNVYWFGSWETGIYKFDGKTLINYTTKHGLPDNRVEEIREDQSGNIFINTRSGLCKFDGQVLMPVTEPVWQASKWDLQPDDLWFKSPKQGYVYRYDGKSLSHLKLPKSKVGEAYLARNPGISDPYGIYYLYKDSKGNMWFGTALLGAFRYNGRSFDWISETDVTEMHNGPANGVRSIIEDKDGLFWFNTEYRYKVYDSVPAGSEMFYERKKSIGNLDGNMNSHLNEYLSIAKDNAHNLWIATYRNGVWRYDGSTIRHYAVRENGKDIHLFYICKDRKGDIWLGTHENGVWKFNGETFIRFTL